MEYNDIFQKIINWREFNQCHTRPQPITIKITDRVGLESTIRLLGDSSPGLYRPDVKNDVVDVENSRCREYQYFISTIFEIKTYTEVDCLSIYHHKQDLKHGLMFLHHSSCQLSIVPKTLYNMNIQNCSQLSII